jgi:hypothetical protein
MVIPALAVVVLVVIALREMIALLLLLVRPSLHHVAEPHDGLGSITTKISKESLISDVVVEAVDDVLLEDVSDGGTYVEEQQV